MLENRFVHPGDLDWMRQDNPCQSSYTPDDYLLLSIRIQQAYEQNRPLLVVCQSQFGLQQYCGYIKSIDPDERHLILRNGTIKREIDFGTVMNVEVL